MVKTATPTVYTETAQTGPKLYQQGIMPGFEMVASAPVVNGSRQKATLGEYHAILPTSTATANHTAPTPDSTKPFRALKARTKTRARAKRGSWPVGVPVAQGYAIYAFYKHHPEKNILREYRLEYAPSLWSAHVVARSWGRRGGKERLAHLEFSDQAEALEYLRRQLAKRVGRGYVLVG